MRIRSKVGSAALVGVLATSMFVVTSSVTATAAGPAPQGQITCQYISGALTFSPAPANAGSTTLMTKWKITAVANNCEDPGTAGTVGGTTGTGDPPVHVESIKITLTGTHVGRDCGSTVNGGPGIWNATGGSLVFNEIASSATVTTFTKLLAAGPVTGGTLFAGSPYTSPFSGTFPGQLSNPGVSGDGGAIINALLDPEAMAKITATCSAAPGPGMAVLGFDQSGPGLTVLP